MVNKKELEIYEQLQFLNRNKKKKNDNSINHC